MKIAGRSIGPGQPPYIVAEMSGNHNGDIERARALIDAAVRTGADAVKLQTYRPDTITLDSREEGFVIKGGPWDGRCLFELYGEAHLPWDWHAPLFAHARQHGISIFSSPFDETAVDLLQSLDAPAYKIASFEAVDLPLIAYVAKTGKPLIISTGMCNLGEISDAVRAAREAGCRDLALLHCVSSYPAPTDQSNVRTIAHLAEAFDCVAGLSDHTLTSAAAISSVALGGSIIEKHLTLARADGGPDAAFSLEPDEFANLVLDCKDAWRALGRVTYDLQGAEKGSVAFRRSLYVVEDIAEGELITKKNVRSIRPGYGLPPKHLPAILNRHAARALKRGEPLSWDALK